MVKIFFIIEEATDPTGEGIGVTKQLVTKQRLDACGRAQSEGACPMDCAVCAVMKATGEADE